MKKMTLSTLAIVVTGWGALTALLPASERDALFELDHDFLSPRPLHGETVSASDQFAMPISVGIVGERLVLADGMGDPAIHVLDRKSGELRRSMGRQGEGPGEFIAPRTVDPISGESAFWVFDGGTQRLTRVDLDSDEPISQVETVALRSGATLLETLWGPDGGVIALGFFGDGRLGYFDAEGDQLASAGRLPPNPMDLPGNVVQHAYQGRIQPDPARERLAVGSRHASRLELYDADGTLRALARSPFEFEPEFEVKETEHGPVMAPLSAMRYGYIDVAAGENVVLGLFSGRTLAANPEDANFGRFVHVFDWDGQFLAAYQLDADVFSITLDEEANALYAIRHLPTPALLKYELPG